MTWTTGNRGWLRTLGVLVPLVVCAVCYGIGPVVGPSEGALLLVLIVVAAAATGDRWTGLLACVAGAAAFDFFLTQPYLDFHIADRQDIELAVVLLLVGLAVSELAIWGARQRATASDREGYIDGVLAVADLNAAGATREATADAVAVQIRRVLGVEGVTFVPGAPEPESAVLDRDGLVAVGDVTLDARKDGLPIDRFTAVPVVLADGSRAHFRITAAANLVKVRAEQLRVVVLLAEQVGRTERPAAEVTAGSGTPGRAR